MVKAFCDPKLDLSPDKIDNMQMGYIFEELIRIGAEQSNEEAGEHFNPTTDTTLSATMITPNMFSTNLLSDRDGLLPL